MLTKVLIVFTFVILSLAFVGWVEWLEKLAVKERRPVRMSPYEHDCTCCKWVGWYTYDGHPCNVYICNVADKEKPTVIIRYSSVPSDYWSNTVGNTIGSVSLTREMYNNALKRNKQKEEMWDG